MAIIVADIHGCLEKAQAFLDYKPEKSHIALGDYLDSFVEPFEQQLECLKMLMNSNAVLLLGNHEVHYLKDPLFRFPGYQSSNAETFQSLLESNLNRFKVAYAVDGWLLTHAGVNSLYTEQENDAEVLSDLFNSSWELYLKNRAMDHETQYLYRSIFQFNHCIYVEGNLLPENVKQIFGHVEHTRPMVEPNYIALDTTNQTNSCWIYDTAENELVQLPLPPSSFIELASRRSLTPSSPVNKIPFQSRVP
jgi:hypothetical protein